MIHSEHTHPADDTVMRSPRARSQTTGAHRSGQVWGQWRERRHMTGRAQYTSKKVNGDIGEDDVAENCVDQEPIEFSGGGGSRGTPTREAEG